ncbi:MAG: DinB family protein [Deltaproteobacteria bacterium]
MGLFDELSRMPALLSRVAEVFPEAAVRARSGSFALVEHVWHLADLEREGFGARIARLLAETDPWLPDFDGERTARERRYLQLDLAEGVAAFAAARAANMKTLRGVDAGQWSRPGRQEGVGAVLLSELPRRMREHDLAHLGEITDLLFELAPEHPMIAGLRALAQGGPPNPQAA